MRGQDDDEDCSGGSGNGIGVRDGGWEGEGHAVSALGY